MNLAGSQTSKSFSRCSLKKYNISLLMLSEASEQVFNKNVNLASAAKGPCVNTQTGFSTWNRQ